MRFELRPVRGGVVRSLANDRSELGQPIELLARCAAEFLTSSSFKYLSICQAEGCGWFFLDGSPGQRRRWCSMNGCGNRAKAQRHYRRKSTSRPKRSSSTKGSRNADSRDSTA
jgi:predicted RNA-binding Zn ribbon-like protein